MLFKPLVGKKEWIDQLAHAAVGAAIVALFALVILPIWAAVLLSLAVGIGREIIQRLQAGMKWYECREGCRLDLAFWSLGAGIGSLIALGVT